MKFGLKILKYFSLVISIILFIYLLYIFIYKYVFSDNKKNTDEPIESKGSKVAIFYGYRYEMPEDCFNELALENGKPVLNIYNNVNKWGGAIRMIDVTQSPADVYASAENLEKFLLSKENKISNKKIIDDKIITFEYDYNGSIGLLAYTEAFDNYIYQIIIYDGDEKTLNYDALNIIIEIVNSATKIE